MKRLCVAVLAVVTLALATTPAEAFGRRKKQCNDGCAPNCAPSCAPQVEVQWVEKTVTVYQKQWAEREETLTVNRVVPREVRVPMTRTVYVPTYENVKQTVTVMRQVPREVEREVTVCHMVSECVVDPCTGCTRTVCRPQTTVQRVRHTVMECVPTAQEVTARVCRMQPTEQKYEVTRIEYETRPEKVTRRVPYCVTVPVEQKVRVPVCVPVAPVCAAPAPAPCY